MKTILTATIATLCAASPAFSAERYTTFRVCEDKHVIHTSDGADAGHVEYIVVDPDQQRIVSTVVTGGIIGQKHVLVPYADMRFGDGQDVTLTEITRERFVAAPVIETTRFTSSSYIEPSYIEPTFTYFGVGIDGGRQSGGGIERSATTTEGAATRTLNTSRTSFDASAPGGVGANDPRMREGTAGAGTATTTREPAAPGARTNATTGVQTPGGRTVAPATETSAAETAAPNAERTPPAPKTAGHKAERTPPTPKSAAESSAAPGEANQPGETAGATAAKPKSTHSAESTAAKEKSARKGTEPAGSGLDRASEKATEGADHATKATKSSASAAETKAESGAAAVKSATKKGAGGEKPDGPPERSDVKAPQ